MNSTKKAYYHLPGLFEFYELYEAFCRYIGSTESISMTGAGLVQYMVRLQTVSGAADESVPVNMVCRKL